MEMAPQISAVKSVSFFASKEAKTLIIALKGRKDKEGKKRWGKLLPALESLEPLEWERFESLDLSIRDVPSKGKDEIKAIAGAVVNRVQDPSFSGPFKEEAQRVFEVAKSGDQEAQKAWVLGSLGGIKSAWRSIISDQEAKAAAAKAAAEDRKAASAAVEGLKKTFKAAFFSGYAVIDELRDLEGVARAIQGTAMKAVHDGKSRAYALALHDWMVQVREIQDLGQDAGGQELYWPKEVNSSTTGKKILEDIARTASCWAAWTDRRIQEEERKSNGSSLLDLFN